MPLFAFAIIAVNIKIRAPNAHTMLEIIRARWGDTAHKVFLAFAITANIVVTAMLLLGGASVMNALTGMNSYAACMLIPVGVAVKTFVGGLKITYFSSLLSTWIILVVIAMFSFRIYATNTEDLLLGSPAKIWANLNTYASAPAPTTLSESSEVAKMQLGPVKGAFLVHV